MQGMVIPVIRESGYCMQQSTAWRRYLVIGALSVLKAVAMRGNQKRFRAELTDAGLFIGLATILRYVEGGGDSGGGAQSWAQEVAQRVRSQNGTAKLGQGTGSSSELQKELSNVVRQEVTRRLGERSNETESSSIRERIWSR